jgi:hypothetical protein
MRREAMVPYSGVQPPEKRAGPRIYAENHAGSSAVTFWDRMFGNTSGRSRTIRGYEADCSR